MSSYLTPLLVALGGALGALTRYTVTLLAASFLGSSFPYGTLLVNGAGSFLIGLLAFFFTQHFPSPLASAFLVTGFLGGLTTFSSMMNEIMHFSLPVTFSKDAPTCSPSSSSDFLPSSPDTFS